MITPSFGCLPSPRDERDYVYSSIRPVETQLPSRIIMDAGFKHPVKDQGQFGSCVGQGWAHIREWQLGKRYPINPPEMSALYIYSECKRQDGIPNQEGTYPRVAASILKKQGVCKESTMPYSLLKHPTTFPEPSQKAHDEAKEFVIGAYARIYSIQEVKQALHRDGPVGCAVYVVENFLQPEGKGFIPMPRGYMMGGHWMVVTGYDDNLEFTYRDAHLGKRTFKGFFRCLNSWGPNWGDNGYCWIPYEFFHGKTDIGLEYWMESWTSVDVILPPKNASTIIITPGNNVAYVDGQPVQLDQPAVIDPKTHRTLAPLRFISENMGWKVHWDGQRVVLTK